MEIRIENLNTIRKAARQFLEAIPADTRVIAFYGSMGAGKTTFVKALCEELGVTDVVTSPTFAIVNEYDVEHSALNCEHLDAPQKPPMHNAQCSMINVQSIYHFDFYRIRRLEEVYDMGYEEYFYAPNALSLIEWPELIESLLPDDTLAVHITQQPDGSRLLSF